MIYVSSHLIEKSILLLNDLKVLQLIKKWMADFHYRIPQLKSLAIGSYLAFG